MNAPEKSVRLVEMIAKAAIDRARADNQTHPLPAEAKDALNTLVQSYNIAREAWLTYRGAVATNTPNGFFDAAFLCGFVVPVSNFNFSFF